MPLYEVAIVSEPTKQQSKDGKQEELLYGPVAVVASTPDNAVLKVVRSKEAAHIEIDNIKVLVRPFV